MHVRGSITGIGVKWKKKKTYEIKFLRKEKEFGLEDGGLYILIKSK